MVREHLEAMMEDYPKLKKVVKDYQKALETVAMYARINHDRPKDYGEIVNPELQKHSKYVAEIK